MEEFFIGHEIRKLSYLLKRAFANTSSLNTDNFNYFQKEVIFAIKNANDRGEFLVQKDLEKELGLKRATVSLGLGSMERDGLITRISVKGDARLKQIVLTDEALELYDACKSKVFYLEELLVEGLTQEEIEVMKLAFAKIEKNAKAITNEK